jgi:hypothetical protein
VIALNIDVPQADIDAMQAAFQRYVVYYKGNLPKALEKTAVQVIKTLRASTKRSTKHRRIVRNPADFKATKNGLGKWGRAHAHIMAWYEYHGTGKRTGRTQHWLPRLKDLVARKSVGKFAIERYTQRKGKQYTPIGGFDPLDKVKASDARAMAISKFPKQYNIARRGVAYSSWGWMLGKLGARAATEQAPDTPGLVAATSVDRYLAPNGETQGIDLADMVSYIRKATRANVGSVISRATSQMMYDMGEITRHAKSAAGLKGAA